MNRNFIYGFITALFIMTIIGCSSILKNNDGVFGKSSKTNDKIDAEIRHVENAQAGVNEDRLSHIGAWSKGGVEYSLSLIKTNIPKEVIVAKEMNERIEALAGKPDFKEVEAIKDIVKNLLSENDKIRIDGEKSLAEKDKEINKLEEHVKNLNYQREEEIAVAMAQADVDARKADQYKATLGQMDSWFGLGAIFYGAKKFIISSVWILAIGFILFFILRILSTTNPIAGAIFSIFNQMGSWAVHTIQMVFPKAVSLAGHVTEGMFNSYKSTLTKLVDSIQLAKNTSITTGTTVNLKDVLNDVEKSMNDDEKSIVNDIKKNLNWK